MTVHLIFGLSKLHPYTDLSIRVIPEHPRDVAVPLAIIQRQQIVRRGLAATREGRYRIFGREKARLFHLARSAGTDLEEMPGIFILSAHPSMDLPARTFLRKVTGQIPRPLVRRIDLVLRDEFDCVPPISRALPR